jgi:glycosyltransferase involved in cell wall biosynthesis
MLFKISGRVRVLHIIDTLWLGGAQTLERDYFEMQRDNPDIFLYALRRSEPQLNIRHKNIWVHNSFRRYNLSPLWEIRNLVRQHHIEVLHCHLLRSHIFGYLLKRFFFPYVKLIIHEQADLIDSSLLSVPALKWMKTTTNLFLTCSDALKEELIKRINPQHDQVKRIYNGISLTTFSSKAIIWDISEERIKLGIPPESFVVGFAGRLIKRKGWEELIETARLCKDIPSIHFLIAGTGPDEKLLQNKIQQYGLEQITHVGYISKINWFYSLLDCLLVPSHHEPMGMIVPEAQAMEVPVIATDVAGMNEITGKNGDALLVKPGDCVSMKSSILRLIQDASLRNNLKAKGLSNAEKYSIEKYIEELNFLYSEIH